MLSHDEQVKIKTAQKNILLVREAMNGYVVADGVPDGVDLEIWQVVLSQAVDKLDKLIPREPPI